MAGEPPLGGSIYGGSWGQGPTGVYTRAGTGPSGTASATMKIDVPGLKDFERQIEAITKGLGGLKTAFENLAKSPKDFAKQLDDVNKELDRLARHMGTSGTGTVSSTSTLGKIKSLFSGTGTGIGTRSANAPVSAGEDAAAASTGGALGGATTAAAIGQAVSAAVGKIFDRIQRGADTTAAADVYLSRIAPSIGTTGRGVFGGLAARGLPFQGSLTEQSQAMYALSQQGYVIGGTGLGGQRGAAAQASINTLQALSPGLGPAEAANIVTGSTQNVAAMRQSMAILGPAAMAYTPTGQLKPLSQRFKELLDALQKRSNHPGTPFTKDQLIASQIPGSNMMTYLTSLGWDDAMVGQFFAFAIAQAQYETNTGATDFTGSERQMQQVRGKSVAVSYQQTQTAQAGRDVQYGADQYQNILQQQSDNQAIIGWLKDIEHNTQGLLGLGARLPGGVGNAIGGAVAGATGGALFATLGAALAPETFGLSIPAAMLLGGLAGGVGLSHGDIGDIGDNGTSQLNPDLRKRVNAMMAANPNISVTSGYRNMQQQKNLWQSGNPNAAPPGKSRHGRGQAADLGPPSQYRWIAANASKFGLDHAAGMGEPWHVQIAGSMVGDPPDSQAWTAAEKSKQLTFGLSRLLAGGQATSGSGVGTTAAAPSAGKDASGAGGSGGQTSGVVPLDTVIQDLYTAGFRGNDLVNMAAIPSRESSYNTSAHNDNANTQDDSYGLWQINVFKGGVNTPTLKAVTGSTDPTQLYDPAIAAKVAYQMYVQSGNTLRPWGGYKGLSNTYNVSQDAVNAAKSAADRLYPQGYGDIGAGYAGGNGGGGGSAFLSQPVVINNTYHVNTGGGSTDPELLARQISSKVDRQFKQIQAARR